jgi:hypothetical protein
MPSNPIFQLETNETVSTFTSAGRAWRWLASLTARHVPARLVVEDHWGNRKVLASYAWSETP